MAEQDLYGIGKGFAQVINTNRSLQTFLIMSQRRQTIEQRENAMLQELVQSYDPNKQKGLQAKDVADYQNLYTQWKKLHLSNKDLMKNPAKYPEQYKQAEQIKQQMNAVAKMSEQDGQFWGDFSKTYQDPKKRDDYMDGSVEVVYNARNTPVLQQMKQRGKLYDWSDIELKYNAPDTKTVFEKVQQVAKTTGGFEYKENTIKPADGVNTFMDIVQPYEEYKPEAVALAYETEIKRDDNVRRYYEQQFKYSKPEEIAAMQQKVKEQTGIDLPIQTGKDLGYADWLVRGSKLMMNTKERKNEKMEGEIRFQEKKRELGLQEAKEKRMDDYRTANDLRLKNTPGAAAPTEQDGLYGFTNEVVDVLKRGDMKTYMQMVTQSFRKKTNTLPTVANPKTMTLQQYKDKYYSLINKDNAYIDGMDEVGVGGGISNRLSEGNKESFDKILESNYRNGRMMLYVPVKDAEGKKKYTVIDPSVKGASEKLLMIMNKGFNFSATQNPENYGTKQKK